MASLFTVGPIILCFYYLPAGSGATARRETAATNC